MLQYVCSRPDCSVKSVRLEKLKLLSSYFTLESGYIGIGLTWIVCALSLIPFLGVKKQSAQATSSDDASAPHYFNGFASATLITVGLSAVEYYFKYPIYTLIYKNYQQFCFVSFVYALLLSVLLFVRSKYVPVTAWNPYAKSGRLLSDLFIGREINPRWFKRIDIKLVHRRVALIATLIINVIFLTRNIKFAPVAAATVEAPLTNTEIVAQFIQSIRLEPVAAAVSILIILNVIDALLFEHHLVGTFELQSEGVGAQLLLQYAAYPIWTSLFAKFALQHKISGVPNWLLGLLCAVYLGGLIFKRLANELKYHYNVYPNSARSSSKYILKKNHLFSSIFFHCYYEFQFKQFLFQFNRLENIAHVPRTSFVDRKILVIDSSSKFVGRNYQRSIIASVAVLQICLATTRCCFVFGNNIIEFSTSYRFAYGSIL